MSYRIVIKELWIKTVGSECIKHVKGMIKHFRVFATFSMILLAMFIKPFSPY